MIGGPTAASSCCLLYTSDAADDTPCVDLGGRRIIKKKNKIKENQSDESGIDDLLSDVKQTDSLISNNLNPLNDLIKGLGFQGGPVLAQVSKKDKDLFKSYLDLPEVRRLLPVNLRYVQFIWGKANQSNDLVDLFIIKSNRDNRPPLSGGVIVDAIQTYSQVGQPAVSMQMDSKGSRIWENMTGKAFKLSLIHI